MRRIAAVVVGLAFGCFVVMRDQQPGAASFAVTTLALVLVAPPRAPFAGSSLPAEPWGGTDPPGPAPGVRIQAVPLAPLVRRPRLRSGGPMWLGILLSAAVMTSFAVAVWPTRCVSTWDGWLMGEECRPDVHLNFYLAVAGVVWAGAVALMIPRRRS